MPISLTHQFLRYAIVGIAAAAGHYATLIGLVETGATGPVVGALAGFMVGGAVSYGLNRRFTFASHRSHVIAIPRFALIAGLAFLLTGLLMELLTTTAGLHYLIAQLITTGVVLAWTFLAHRFWTFTATA